MAYWSATVFDFSCLAGILSLQASTCEFLRGSQPLKASHLSFQLLENSLSIDAYLCPCTENSDSVHSSACNACAAQLHYRYKTAILRARNAVYARTRAELAKQKRWVFPRVHGITSPFGPGGWSGLGVATLDEKVTTRAAALEWLRVTKEVRGTAESDGAGSPSKEARCTFAHRRSTSASWASCISWR